MEDCSFGAGSPTYGFRKDRSAADLFVYLTHHWAQTIESKVDGEFSNPRLLINAGIPQGCVLSPTMFILHIIDMLGITAIHSYLCLWTEFNEERRFGLIPAASFCHRSTR